MEKQNSPTRSVERALEILECFLDKEEMILLEIAERMGFHRVPHFASLRHCRNMILW